MGPKTRLTDGEVNRLYAEALKDFGCVFAEENRKPAWLRFNSEPSDRRMTEDYNCGGHISFPMSATIAENSVNLVIKSWLKDGFQYKSWDRNRAFGR
jgi:hypothetical protein